MFELSQSSVLGFMGLGTPELLIVAAVFLLLFGGAKLPSLMRNMGRSVNEFKGGLKEKPVEDTIEDKSTADEEDQQQPVG